MEIRAISWNLFHGRDKPPDPALFTWRGRITRHTERNGTHAQVNRDLTAEFAGVLAHADWDVALLQEVPTRFCVPLAALTTSQPHRVLTSRNTVPRLRLAVARRNPDLIASGEGGSNVTLVRRDGTLGPIAERRDLVLRPRLPERRTMAFTRTGSGVCIANLHTSNDRPDLAAPELTLAAETATAWAGDAPLIFGGDFNLRPRDDPAPFRELERRFGLAAPTGRRSIDHILVRGLDVIDPSAPWPPDAREVADVGRTGLAIRLSDHAPVEARFDRPRNPAPAFGAEAAG